MKTAFLNKKDPKDKTSLIELAAKDYNKIVWGNETRRTQDEKETIAYEVAEKYGLRPSFFIKLVVKYRH